MTSRHSETVAAEVTLSEEGCKSLKARIEQAIRMEKINVRQLVVQVFSTGRVILEGKSTRYSEKQFAQGLAILAGADEWKIENNIEVI